MICNKLLILILLLSTLGSSVYVIAEPSSNSTALSNVPPPPVLKGAVSATGASRLVRRIDTSKEDTAKLNSQRGLIALGKDQFDEALKYFEKVLDDKPTDTAAMDHLAYIYEQKNDMQGAYTYTWLADRIDKTSGSMDEKAARRQAKVTQMEAQMTATIKANGGGHFTTRDWWPRNLQKSIVCRGVHLYGMGDVKNAYKLFEEVLRLNASNADALYDIGVLCEQEKLFGRAEEYYKAAMQASAGHMDAGANEALLSMGQKEIRFRGGVNKLNAPLLEKSHFTCQLCRIMRDTLMDCN